MTTVKSNEVLQANIESIQADIKEIKQKLDTKYVSHETFQLTIQTLQELVVANRAESDARFNLIFKVSLAIGTPLIGAIITLLFKVFTS